MPIFNLHEFLYSNRNFNSGNNRVCCFPCDYNLYMNNLTSDNLILPLNESTPNPAQSLQRRFQIQSEEYNDYAPPSYEELFGK